MPITETHNIDTVIDGQLYIGKYAFLSHPSVPFPFTHPPHLTAFLLQSPSTFADILTSRILFLHVRTIPYKDPIT